MVFTLYRVLYGLWAIDQILKFKNHSNLPPRPSPSSFLASLYSSSFLAHFPRIFLSFLYLLAPIFSLHFSALSQFFSFLFQDFASAQHKLKVRKLMISIRLKKLNVIFHFSLQVAYREDFVV